MKESQARERLKRIAKKNNEYIKNNYDRVVVLAPPGTKDKIKAVLGPGESASQFINALISEEIERRELLTAASDQSGESSGNISGNISGMTEEQKSGDSSGEPEDDENFLPFH